MAKIKLLSYIRNEDKRTTLALKQILFSFGYKGISIVIGIAYVPVLLNYLGLDKYGIWITLTSFLAWFSFFNIGLGNGLRNRLTEAIANNDYDLGKKYVSTTYFLLILIFGAVLLLFLVVNPFLNWNRILNTKSIPNHELFLLAGIVFSFFIIKFVVQLLSVVFFAYQKPSFSNLINMSGNLLSFLSVLVLVHSSTRVNLVVLGSIISAIPVLLFIVASFVAYNGRYKMVRPSYKSIDIKSSYGLVSLGAKFFFLQIASIIIFSTSSFFIAQFYGAGEVAIYNIAFKYFQMPIMIYLLQNWIQMEMFFGLHQKEIYQMITDGV